MNFVEPIREIKHIETIKKLLKDNPRDHLLFVIGINTAFRVSDLLELKYKDVMDEKQNLHTYFKLKETKTGKNNKVIITKNVQKALKSYIKENFNGELDEYLFKSRKGVRAINRKSAWRIIGDAARIIGLTDIGVHSLRKTFAYHQYKAGTDIVLLQDMLNHSSPAITLRYIGITQDEKDRAVMALDL
ncbi:MAG: tyrosine-type recombinase/integrase [Thermotaleaceae bacterium]